MGPRLSGLLRGLRRVITEAHPYKGVLREGQNAVKGSVELALQRAEYRTQGNPLDAIEALRVERTPVPGFPWAAVQEAPPPGPSGRIVNTLGQPIGGAPAAPRPLYSAGGMPMDPHATLPPLPKRNIIVPNLEAPAPTRSAADLEIIGSGRKRLWAETLGKQRVAAKAREPSPRASSEGRTTSKSGMERGSRSAMPGWWPAAMPPRLLLAKPARAHPPLHLRLQVWVRLARCRKTVIRFGDRLARVRVPPERTSLGIKVLERRGPNAGPQRSAIRR